MLHRPRHAATPLLPRSSLSITPGVKFSAMTSAHCTRRFITSRDWGCFRSSVIDCATRIIAWKKDARGCSRGISARLAWSNVISNVRVAGSSRRWNTGERLGWATCVCGGGGAPAMCNNSEEKSLPTTGKQIETRKGSTRGHAQISGCDKELQARCVQGQTVCGSDVHTRDAQCCELTHPLAPVEQLKSGKVDSSSPATHAHAFPRGRFDLDDIRT